LLVGVALALLMLTILGLIVFTNRPTMPDTSIFTPEVTAEATADCAFLLPLWQQSQTDILNIFLVDATSATLTMPGERLDGNLLALQTLRQTMPLLPPCTEPSVQTRYLATLTTMDDILALLYRWQSGDISASQLTHEFFELEKEVRVGTASN
jgi:hypothetical protein